jgi:hypothetical protein
VVAALVATHDATLSRVRLASTGWAGPDLTVRYYVRPSGAAAWTTVRGSDAVPVSGGVALIAYDYEFPWSGTGVGHVDYAAYSSVTNTWAYALTTSVDITATAWLKVPGYPSLNRKINPSRIGDTQREGRYSLIPIVASTRPGSTVDTMSGQSTEITIPTETWAEYKALDTLLKVGGVLFLHSDEEDLGIPSMYAVVRRMRVRLTPKTHSPRRRLDVDLEEVATPHYAYAGAVGTWQSVLTQYATWQDVLNAYPTWLDLAQIVGGPGDVVVS